MGAYPKPHIVIGARVIDYDNVFFYLKFDPL